MNSKIMVGRNTLIDSVLYLIYIKNEMEWVQLLTQFNGLTQSLMFLVVDRVLYLTNIRNEIEWVQSPWTFSTNYVVDRLLKWQTLVRLSEYNHPRLTQSRALYWVIRPTQSHS